MVFVYLDFIDKYIEKYLSNVIKPFLVWHEKFYSAMNQTLRSGLDKNAKYIPDWFTANFITYLRTMLVIPTLVLLSLDHTILPSLLIILVDFGDFLDGVVARYWNDHMASSKQQEETPELVAEKASSPNTSDDDSFGK